jgi:FkbM family methyltransferase
MKHILRLVYKKLKYHFYLPKVERKLLVTKLEKEGVIDLFDTPFYFHHGKAFYDTYKEIFEQNIYAFRSSTDTPLIIDCGANIGLSLLYFSKKLPKAKIIAFEPDQTVLPYLKKNIEHSKMTQVELHEVAVWDRVTEMKFYTDKGMGGRVENAFENQEAVIIQTVRLRDFLKEPVALLKIDIEGAEYRVLKDCADVLSNVACLFVEYHSSVTEEQHLDEILDILKKSGFRYHLKESFSRKKPFINRHILCEKFDMAINVFAYRD